MRTFTFASVDELPADFWKWPHVNPRTEWACKGDGTLLVAPDFLDRFEALRATYARPLVITSGYRSPEYNLRVAHTGADGPHTTGHAADVAIATSHEAYRLAELAFRYGFQGIGVSQRAGQPRFVHLDDLPGDDNTPRPGLWSY